MSDTMTLYKGDAETVIIIEAQPDPREPSRFLFKSPNGEPMRGKLSLREHAYNVLLPPNSYIIIDADEAELFKESHSNDRVIFALPSDDPAGFYVDQYITGAKGQSPYTAVILRLRENSRIISAALYPRDLESLPAPFLMTPDGKIGRATSKDPGASADSDDKIAQPHNPGDLEFILKAIYQPVEKPVIVPDLPKESWF